MTARLLSEKQAQRRWNLNKFQKYTFNVKFYLYSKLRESFRDVKVIHDYFDDKITIIKIYQGDYIRNNKAILETMPWNNERKYTDRVTEFLRNPQATKEFNERFPDGGVQYTEVQKELMKGNQ